MRFEINLDFGWSIALFILYAQPLEYIILGDMFRLLLSQNVKVVA